MVLNNKYINITKKELDGIRAAEKKSGREEERKAASNAAGQQFVQEERLRKEYEALVKESAVIVDGYQKLQERVKMLEGKYEKEAGEKRILQKRLEKAAQRLEEEKETAEEANSRVQQLEEYIGRLQRSNQYLLEHCQELEEENVALKAEIADMIAVKRDGPERAEGIRSGVSESADGDVSRYSEKTAAADENESPAGFYDSDDEKVNTETFEQEPLWKLMDEETEAEEAGGEWELPEETEGFEVPARDNVIDHLKREEDSYLFILNVQSDVSRTIDKVQERIQGLFQKE